jgi:hypothetical protein
MKLYVKKVWSYNPTQYEYVTLEKAHEKYNDYVISCYKSSIASRLPKSFEQWLKTEI